MNGCGRNDLVNGNAGNDGVSGGQGNSAVSGGDGDDNVRGGAGNDIKFGNAGTDYFDWRGPANDIFFCRSGGTDRIIDFQPGQDLRFGTCILSRY